MITVPTLLLDEQKCRKNIRTMAQKARHHQLSFRPHFKTHQSLKVAEWFRDEGVDKITVSSLDMALYFMEGGWNDITVAFPVNILEIEKINQLASQIKLNLIAVNVESIRYLSQNLKHPLNVFLKIDVGYHRTGILPNDRKLIDDTLKESKESKNITFSGFLGHAGHSYAAKGDKQIEKVHLQSLSIKKELKAQYESEYPNLMISLGDTPTCSRMDNFQGVDEIRPGNFAFYDLAQWSIGSCDINQIAVAMACPIVAKHSDRNEIIIYGGGVHFSKDRVYNEALGKDFYGFAVPLENNHWKLPDQKSYLSKISQEHGTIKASKEFFNSHEVGDIIGVIPIHSCMTADCMKSYLSTKGERILMKN
ncbi:alanine racemase [Xanthovirga aplysinae]|uniref:alanine racemase n=1 Tax=Xanthovirga aplysinae TaxID=2529853 RepID=UPI0012BD5647|nr:alanine racemase [Xanthovirga aplysinae]MTI32037.1 alanine racemase [Xanthovirga aplysinae]